jgi:hypothetical protein
MRRVKLPGFIKLRKPATTVAEQSYALRVSSRARRVQLRVRPYVGLEVVVPKRFPRNQIGRILQQHQSWIIAQLNKHASSMTPPDPPDTIDLALTGERYPIEYCRAPRTNIRQESGQLRLMTPDSNPSLDEVTGLLRGWVRQRAREWLPTRLTQLADEFGFEYKRTTIRSQKSRWGSCSSKGTISLNDQLLFLPPDTVDYLLIHELCHTRHMNHSAAFWRLVERCMPGYQIHDQLINRAKEKVPQWFLYDLYRS